MRTSVSPCTGVRTSYFCSWDPLPSSWTFESFFFSGSAFRAMTGLPDPTRSGPSREPAQLVPRPHVAHWGCFHFLAPFDYPTVSPSCQRLSERHRPEGKATGSSLLTVLGAGRPRSGCRPRSRCRPVGSGEGPPPGLQTATPWPCAHVAKRGEGEASFPVSLHVRPPMPVRGPTLVLSSNPITSQRPHLLTFSHPGGQGYSVRT